METKTYKYYRIDGSIEWEIISIDNDFNKKYYGYDNHVYQEVYLNLKNEISRIDGPARIGYIKCECLN